MTSPANHTDIDWLVREFERGPGGKRAMRKARRWLGRSKFRWGLLTRIRLLLGMGPGWRW